MHCITRETTNAAFRVTGNGDSIIIDPTKQPELSCPRRMDLIPERMRAARVFSQTSARKMIRDKCHRVSMTLDTISGVRRRPMIPGRRLWLVSLGSQD